MCDFTPLFDGVVGAAILWIDLCHACDVKVGKWCLGWRAETIVVAFDHWLGVVGTPDVSVQ